MKGRLTKTSVFSFKGKQFQLIADGKPYALSKKDITVMVNPRTGMKAQYRNYVYDVKCCTASDLLPVSKKAESPRHSAKG